jgi:hypothetical protein
MKKILNLVIVAFAAMVMSGCASMVNVKGVNPDKVTIWDGEKENMFRINPTSSGYKQMNKIHDVKRGLNATAKLGLSKGYKYMSLVNRGVNNLNGFPFNNWESLKKYMLLHKTLKNESHFRIRTNGTGNNFLVNSGTYIKVVFLKNKIPGLFLWDLEKLKRDTI